MHRKADLLMHRAFQAQISHHCEITDSDYKQIIPKMEVISQLAEIEHSAYAVFDMHKCNYLLQSEEQKKIFGNNNNISIKDHYQSIHPDDLPFVLETDKMVYDFYSEHNTVQKKDYKLVYNFRTRTSEGNFKHFMHQCVILELDKNGKAWLSLVISHLLPDEEKDTKTQRRFYHMKTGKLFLFTKMDNYSSAINLTKREMEILKYISMGYDSINIADKLNISINTVNNHRQNIIRKTQSDNTTQALLYCQRLGII